MKRKVIDILNMASSKKLTFSLISLVALAVIAEMIILLSQWDSSVSIATQTGIIYRSLWFQGLCLLLLVNLIVCTIKTTFRRVKHRQGLALWGSTIFHVGLILIIAGCLLSANWRMEGIIKIILGETKYDTPTQYEEIHRSRFFRDKDFRNFGITLTKLDIELDNSNLNNNYYFKMVKSFLKLQEGQNISFHNIEMAEQFAYGNCYLYMKEVNYVLRFRLQTSSGTREMTIPLDYFKWGGGSVTMDREPFKISPFNHIFSAELIPNLSKNGSPMPGTSKFLQLENPAVSITMKAANDENKVLAKQFLRPGETMSIDGSKLTFLTAKPYSEFSVVYDPGAKIVFAGMALAVVGLSVIYLFKQLRRSSSSNPVGKNF